MLSRKMESALNGQINNEMYSAYLYMAMSSHANDRGLKGFAAWFMVQYHEEMFHAMKLYEYVQRQGNSVKLEAIKQPPNTWKSPMEMFQQTLKHEQFITSCFNELTELAIKEKDHATQIFLQWYVTEQVEEEENDNEIIGMLKVAGDNTHALMMIDRDIGSRGTTVPTDYSRGIEAALKAAQ
ncbi:MAG: ferritin [Chitinivibrionales bacterium]|nr:ferritin [Chitinivibrionales bacterium]